MRHKGVPFIWDLLNRGNPNLSGDLDRVIEKSDPANCWPAKSQRKRTDNPHGRRPRKWVGYDGKRHQPTLARLVLAQQNGSIGEGDACHICEKNPWCCNPDHLFEGSPEFNRAYDAHVRKERRGMLDKCPRGKISMIILPVSTIAPDAKLPEGWPTHHEIIADQPELAEAPDMIIWELEKPKQEN
jgi:hypothetical protein